MYSLSQTYLCPPPPRMHSCEAGPTSAFDRPAIQMVPAPSPADYSRLESLAYSHQGYSCDGLYQKPGVAYSLGAYHGPASDGVSLLRNYGNLFQLPVAAPSAGQAFPAAVLGYFRLPSYGAGVAGGNFQAPLFSSSHAEYHFHPEEFLRPGREGKFIGKAEEIREHVEEAFEKMLGMPFPPDIAIRICSVQEFRKIAPHPSTIGLSINRRQEGLLSEIFVLNSTLARVMLTLGHELGHVLTATLSSPHSEEAKAYAFSLAWMKTIKQHNLAGLGNAIVSELPAENGLHNVAFGFVESRLRQGQDAWEVYGELVRKELAVAG